MTFIVETEQNNKRAFFEVNIIHKQGKFILGVYRRTTVSGVYTHFDGFLPDTYKIGMIYTLVNRCFRIYVPPSSPVWMSSCYIVCYALWTSVISFLLVLLILCKILDLKKNCKF